MVNLLVVVEGGVCQIECMINGFGECVGNIVLEEVVMVLKVCGDIMLFYIGIDIKKIMYILCCVLIVLGFFVQFNKVIVGKNVFVYESGIYQDGMLKNVEMFEIMCFEDVGIVGIFLLFGKYLGCVVLWVKLNDLGIEIGDN